MNRHRTGEADRRRLRTTFGLLAGLALTGCWGQDRQQTELPASKLGETTTVSSQSVETGALPFSVPSDFIAERVAGPDLVKFPMFVDFDDQGRLYVAASSGHNRDAKSLGKDPSDAIHRLEDSDGDGLFDKSVVYADKLTYPQGVLWHDGAVFTASPPSLWRLEDTDGDGLADRRRELVTGFPFTGIADDLHGPNLGPDGRLYWGVGRFKYAIRKPGGPLIRQGEAPLIMRCRPDGEDVEVFCAAMGNPVEVAFNPSGEIFACGTFLAPESQGKGLRDALIHCVEGGYYSVRDRTLIEEKKTGDPLPPMAHLGVAAGSGITYDQAGDLGSGRPTLFAAMFNLHKVPRFLLQRDGTTFRTRMEDFLVSNDPDFHPTDVLIDADGSMLVVDTGSWFRSCPTSQIDKQDVFGGIYRIRRKQRVAVPDPRGLSLDWTQPETAELVRRLSDDRFVVRDRAVRELAKRGADAVPLLRKIPPTARPRLRIDAIRTLTRIDGPEARAAVRSALNSRDARVQLAAAQAVGLHRDAEALTRLLRLVRSGQPPVRREAATALGRLGRAEAVPALMEALRASDDRFAEHALIRALILIADRDATLPGLTDPSPLVRRGALTALDQMEGGRLTPDLVLPLLDPAVPDVRQRALRVIASRPDWAEVMIGPLRTWLAREQSDPSQQEDLQRVMLAFCSAPAVQEEMVKALLRPSTPVETRILLMLTMERIPPAQYPVAWVEALGTVLRDPDPEIVAQAVSTIRIVQIEDHHEVLLGIALDSSRTDELRLDALASLATRLVSVEPALFAYLLGFLDREQPPLLRWSAAKVLGQAPLNADQLTELTSSVAEVGPSVLPRLLPAFSQAQDAALGSQLLAALGRSPGLVGLTPDDLEIAFGSFPEGLRREAESLRQRLDRDVQEKTARLAKLDTLLKEGDPRQGREVFFGSKAACSTCHTILGEGGHVGPDLSLIGASRTGRDLLEAILFPSASFARGYEPHLIATGDGRTHAGIILRETADQVCLVTADRTEHYLPRSAIEAIEPAKVSIMPQGLEANLSQRELSDLVSYLKSLQ